MMGSDDRDDRDGLLHYRALRARAPEGLSAKSVMVVTVVTEAIFPFHGPSGELWAVYLKVQAGSRPA
jgi:hypothetical protein